MILAVSATQSNIDMMFSVYLLNYIGEIAQEVMRLLIKQRVLSSNLDQSYFFFHFYPLLNTNRHIFLNIRICLLKCLESFFPLRVGFHQLYKYIAYHID